MVSERARGGVSPDLRLRRSDGVYVEEDDGARSRGVLVAFTDRRGGVSADPYSALNLAMSTGDEPDHVTANRRRAASAVGFDEGALVLARQVHGSRVLDVAREARGVIGSADGLVARSPGPVLGILTADCAPVVVAGEGGVALLHAGWRGVVAGVVERGVAEIGRAWAGWVGPSIRACCYRVGPEVVAAFERAGLPVAGEERVDPARAAAFALERAGVERVAASSRCTGCSPELYSYRRDGVTGRQGAFAALLEE